MSLQIAYQELLLVNRVLMKTLWKNKETARNSWLEKIT